MSQDKIITCKNCGDRTQGDYCVSCGQRTSISKVTFKETLQDLVDALFSVDAPLLTTLKQLVVNPGRLFTEYLGGKRKKYYRPVTFFILMTVVYLVVRSVLDFNPFNNTVLKIDDPSDNELFTKAGRFMLQNIDKFLFVFVFTLGSFLKLFFYKKYNFAEFLAISFFLLGAYTLLTIFNMFYMQYIDNSFQGIHIGIMLLFFIYAMLSLFKKNKFGVIFKSILIYVLAIFFYGFLAFGLSFFIIWLKNN